MTDRRYVEKTADAGARKISLLLDEAEVCVDEASNRLIRLSVLANGLFRYWTHTSLEPGARLPAQSNHKVGGL